MLLLLLLFVCLCIVSAESLKVDDKTKREREEKKIQTNVDGCLFLLSRSLAPKPISVALFYRLSLCNRNKMFQDFGVSTRAFKLAQTQNGPLFVFFLCIKINVYVCIHFHFRPLFVVFIFVESNEMREKTKISSSFYFPFVSIESTPLFFLVLDIYIGTCALGLCIFLYLPNKIMTKK